MAMFEFKLPDIGEGVAEGEIVAWLVKAGEHVAEDQTMVEVMTDKATVTIGAPKAGHDRRDARRGRATSCRCTRCSSCSTSTRRRRAAAPRAAAPAPAPARRRRTARQGRRAGGDRGRRHQRDAARHGPGRGAAPRRRRRPQRRRRGAAATSTTSRSPRRRRASSRASSASICARVAAERARRAASPRTTCAARQARGAARAARARAAAPGARRDRRAAGAALAAPRRTPSRARRRSSRAAARRALEERVPFARHAQAHLREAWRGRSTPPRTSPSSRSATSRALKALRDAPQARAPRSAGREAHVPAVHRQGRRRGAEEAPDRSTARSTRRRNELVFRKLLQHRHRHLDRGRADRARSCATPIARASSTIAREIERLGERRQGRQGRSCEDLGGSTFTITSLGAAGRPVRDADHQLPRGRHPRRPPDQAEAGGAGTARS